MGKISLYFLLACITLASNAQAQGIVFEHDNFATVKAKAKAQKKMIFIDFYTAWCGPCKRMAETTFKNDSVGSFFNQHFISTKIDAEKGEGRQLAAAYGVSVYPTFLFLDEDGHLYKKGIGYTVDTAFISIANTAVQEFAKPDNLIKLAVVYPTKKTDAAFLRLYMSKLVENKQPATAVIEQYLSVQKSMQPGSKPMLDFLTKYWYQLTLGGKADYILKQYDSAYKQLADSAQRVLLTSGRNAHMFRTQAYAAETKNPELLKVYIQARKNRPEAERAFFNEQEAWLDYYRASGQWDIYRRLANKWLDSISATLHPLPDSLDNINPFKRNPMSATVIAYKHAAGVVSDNAKIYYLQFPNEAGVLDKVKKWVAASIPVNKTNAFALSFYANLLYTAGDTTAAIQMKERSLKSFPQVSLHRDIAQGNLVRMQHGEILEEE